jgi:hypothetical protein
VAAFVCYFYTISPLRRFRLRPFSPNPCSRTRYLLSLAVRGRAWAPRARPIGVGMASRLFSFPLVTAEEIENSPTVRGRPNQERKAAAGEEHQLRKKAIVAIFNAFQEPAKEEEERRDPASRGRLAESDKK